MAELVLLITKPYMERRAYATCRKVWPDTEPVCVSDRAQFANYLASIGDHRFVIEFLVGDLDRVISYPKLGFAVEQEVPPDVLAAYGRLIAAGYVGRLLTK